MKTVFADSGYWVALLDPHDDLHARARQVAGSLLCPVVTSEMVLVEVLAYFSGKHAKARYGAYSVIRTLKSDPQVTIIQQTTQLFDRALALYGKTQDKAWSLTDCASFEIMHQKRIKEALAYDHHFEQAGFVALLR